MGKASEVPSVKSAATTNRHARLKGAFIHLTVGIRTIRIANLLIFGEGVTSGEEEANLPLLIPLPIVSLLRNFFALMQSTTSRI